ncbi:hypothetical protein [Clostridium sp.]|jgi:uncharacterized protein (UPF0212 family)|uniref:hypothetical protein n=1 Tax=Clostridium sp. TaxID=1506 RepID=UPI002FDE9038
MTCPYCGENFDATIYGRSEHGSNISDKIDLQYGIFKCPNCKKSLKQGGKN